MSEVEEIVRVPVVPCRKSPQVVMLRKARVPSKAGEACHIYLPTDMLGKSIVGVVIRNED